MKRFIKVLSVVSLSSMYLMQVPCTSAGHPALDTLGGNGISILPNLPSPVDFFAGLPIIGGFF
jgi:hypothetical protein